MSLEAKEKLVGFLQTDFSTAGDPTNKDLILQRSLSLENAHIGDQVELFLGSACISGIGKSVIAKKIQQAHIEMTKVPSEISPSALGLEGDGLGIYDPDLAPDLEARLYRASLFKEIQEFISVREVGTEKVVFVRSPVGLQLLMGVLAAWREDFVRQHNKDLLGPEGINILALARQEEAIDPDSFLGQIIQKVNRIDDGENPTEFQFSNN